MKSLSLKRLLSASILITLLSIAIIGCGPSPFAERGVFVIAIDGLRPDMMQEAHTPTLDRLAEQGSANLSAKATVPTQTRVNFVSIPTGVHADKHGVIGAGYMNEDWQYRSTDWPNYQEAQENVPVPTIFEVLEEREIKTGYIAMKGYELVGGRGASHQVELKDYLRREVWDNRYEMEVDGSEEKALELKLEMDDVLLERLKDAVENRRVEFAIANFAALDYAGHQHGVKNDFYRRTVERADAHLADFIEFLEAGNFYENYTILITSDHGFTHILNPENVIMGGGRDEPDIPALADSGIEHAGLSRGGSAFSLFIRNRADVREAYEIIRDKEWAEKIYSEHNLPGLGGTLSEINYYNPPRSGDFFIDVAPSHTVGFASKGQHGSSADRDRLIPHIFAGHGIREGVTIEKSENIDLAPTVLALYGINHEQHLESVGRVITEALE